MKPVTIIVIIMMLSSCDMLRGNKFEMTNETGHTLEDIQVSFADVSAKRQSLGPNERLYFEPSPKRDGGISISYVVGRNRIKREVGYVAPPFSIRCKYRVTNDGLLGECKSPE